MPKSLFKGLSGKCRCHSNGYSVRLHGFACRARAAPVCEETDRLGQAEMDNGRLLAASQDARSGAKRRRSLAAASAEAGRR
jgi:hypothetical protein